ncbi:L,D-transpeptidase family protein [Streptomyces sp. NBC_00306]|uniref:L,D-transpeptidase family protein n=1 Tax=Streptomyces sp. NBC_00306 TaxID=2975708 RepID=UPI002E29F495|nr:L,D-transpeptidase family protein [Streptomyces sp. NBC_00306]
MLRNTIGRTIAAAAVLAVTVGCTAQAAVPDRPGSDGKPGSSAPAPEATPAPTRPSPATPSGKPKQTQKPASPSASAEPAEVLMARGSKGAKVRELQARLAQIGWFDDTPTGTYGSVTADAVKGFQTKRGLPVTGDTDTVTWQKVLGMTKKPTSDELAGRKVNKPSAKLDPRCLTGRVMCISKTSRTLSWVVDGTVRSTMDVRFGSQYTPTREGTFGVFAKSRDHVSTIYHTPMPYAMFFSGGQAVHYSADFAARGYNGASHGCANVRDKGAIASLFAQVRIGDKVVIHW